MTIETLSSDRRSNKNEAGSGLQGVVYCWTLNDLWSVSEVVITLPCHGSITDSNSVQTANLCGYSLVVK